MSQIASTSSAERVNILHLSDLHFGREDKASQEVVLEYFLDDLRRLSNSEWRPSFAIFSGDVVHDPDIVTYDEVIGSLFLPIMDILNLNTDQFAFCPGNHDVSRKYIAENEGLHRGFTGAIGDSSIALKHFTVELNYGYFYGKCEKFFKFMKEFGLTPKNPFFWEVPIPGTSLSAMSLNTVLYSNAGSNGVTDNQRLMYPVAAMDVAFGRQGTNKKLISFSHHPLDWIIESNRADLDLLIQNRVDFHLYGHIHTAAPQFRKGSAGQAIFLQGGALYNFRNNYNGYSILSIDLQTLNSKVLYRSYYPLRLEFDDGTNVAPEGVFYPLDTAKSWWHNYSKRITDKRLYSIIKSSALEKLDPVLNEGIDARPLKQYFTPFPLAGVDTKREAEGAKIARQALSFSDIIFDDKNYAIVVPGEFGQTASAKQLAYQYLSNCTAEGFIRIPVLIDLARTDQFYDAAIERAVKHFLSEVNRDGIKIEDLIAEGRVLFIFENLSIDQEKISKLCKQK